MKRGLSSQTTSFPWVRYSKKLISKIEKAQSAGIFTPKEAQERAMRLVDATAGLPEEGNCVRLYWLVDPDDGIIVDAKYQAFGQSALIGAAEVACELVVGKNYDQAARISAALIDQQVQDNATGVGFPSETAPHLNLVLEAIEAGAEQCKDLPLPSAYVAPPVPLEMGEIREGGYPGWDGMSVEMKIAIIEDVLDHDIRPYIALDAGGVIVKDLINDCDLVIAYQGSCTSCYSSVGTTLSYIQQVIRAKVHPTIKVVPDLDNLKFR